MDRDDTPVGRVLSRREVLAALGASGLAILAGDSRTAHAWISPRPRVPACVARPAQTEGPYFVDRMLQRSDIRSDPSGGGVKEGIPLALTFAVSALRAGSCAPLAGAHVDIWHCDAMWVYSGVEDPGFDTVGQSFLRGYQITTATRTTASSPAAETSSCSRRAPRATAMRGGSRSGSSSPDRGYSGRGMEKPSHGPRGEPSPCAARCTTGWHTAARTTTDR